MDKDRWNNVLVEWVNCLKLSKPIRSPNDLKDGEFFSNLQKLITKSAKCHSDPLTFIFELIGKHYPKFRIANKSEIHLIDLPDDDLHSITTLLMHYTCIYDRRDVLTSPLCHNLTSPTQMLIRSFLQKITSKVSNSDILRIIDECFEESASKTLRNQWLSTSPTDSYSSPLQDLLLKTPISKFGRLQQKDRLISALKSDLESERCEKCDLQSELSLQVERNKKFERQLAQKSHEIERLRGEILEFDRKSPNSKSDECKDLHQRLKSEIESLELYVKKSDSELEQLTNERDDYGKQLRRFVGEVSMWQEKFFDLERNFEDLSLHSQSQNVKVEMLEAECEELRAFLDEYRAKPANESSIIFEDKSSLIASSPSCENLACSVIEVQLKESQDKMNEFKAKLEELEEISGVKIENLQRDLEKSESSYKSALEVTISLNNRLEELEIIKLSLESQVKDFSELNSHLGDQLKGSEAISGVLKVEIEDLKMEAREAEAKLCQLEKENAVTNEMLVKLEKDLKIKETEEIRLIEELESKKEEITRLEQQIADSTKRIDEIVTKNNNLEVTALEMEKKCCQLEEEKSLIVQKLLKLESDFKIKETEEIQLIDELESKKEEITRLEQQIADSTKIIDEIVTKNNNLEVTALEVEKKCCQLEEEKSLTTQKLLKLENELKIKETEQIRLTDELESKKVEITRLQQLIVDFTMRIDEISTENNNLKATVLEVEEKCCQLEEEKSLTTQNLLKLENELKVKETEQIQLTDKLESKKEEITRLEQLIVDFTMRIDEISTENNNLKATTLEVEKKCCQLEEEKSLTIQKLLNLENDLKVKETEQIRLIGDLKWKETELERLEQLNFDCTKRILEIETEKENLKVTIREIEAKCYQLEEEKSVISEKSLELERDLKIKENVQIELHEILAKLNGDLDGQKSEIQRLEQLNRDSVRKIDEMAAETRYLKEAVREYETKCCQLEKEKILADETLLEVEKAMSINIDNEKYYEEVTMDLTNVITGLNNDLKEQKSKNLQLQQINSDTGKMCEEISRENQDLQSRIENLKFENINFKKNAEVLKRDLEECKKSTELLREAHVKKIDEMAAETRDLKETVREYETKCCQLEKEKILADETLLEVEKAMNTNIDKEKYYEKVTTDLTNFITGLNNDLKEQKSKNLQLHQININTGKMCQEISLKIRNSESQNNTLKQENTFMKNEKEIIEKELEKREKCIETLREVHNRQMAETLDENKRIQDQLSKTHEDFESVLATSRAQSEELRQNIDDMAKSNENLENQVAKLTGTARELEETLQSEISKLKQLEGTKSQLEDELSQARDEIDSAKAKFEESAKIEIVLQEEVANLKDANEEIGKTARILEEKHSKMARSYQDLEKVWKCHVDKLEEVERAKLLVENRLAILETEYEKVQENHQSLEKELQEMSKILEKVMKASDSSAEKEVHFQKLEDILKDRMMEMEELEMAKRHLESELVTVREDYDQSEDQRTTLIDEVESLKEENVGLKAQMKELEEMRDRFMRVKADYEGLRSEKVDLESKLEKNEEILRENRILEEKSRIRHEEFEKLTKDLEEMDRFKNANANLEIKVKEFELLRYFMEDQVKEAHDMIKNLRKRLDDSKSANSGLEMENAKIGELVTILTEEKRDLEIKLEDLVQHLKEVEISKSEELEEARNEIERLQKSYEVLEKNFQTSEHLRIELEEKMSILGEEKSAIEENFALLMNTEVTLSKIIENREEEISKLTNDIKSLTKELKENEFSKIAEVLKAKNKFENLEKSYADLKQKQNQLEDKIILLESEKSEILTKLELVVVEKSIIEKKFKAIEKDLELKIEKLRSNEETIQDYELTISGLKSALDENLQTLTSLKNDKSLIDIESRNNEEILKNLIEILKTHKIIDNSYDFENDENLSEIVENNLKKSQVGEENLKTDFIKTLNRLQISLLGKIEIETDFDDLDSCVGKIFEKLDSAIQIKNKICADYYNKQNNKVDNKENVLSSVRNDNGVEKSAKEDELKKKNLILKQKLVLVENSKNNLEKVIKNLREENKKSNNSSDSIEIKNIQNAYGQVKSINSKLELENSTLRKLIEERNLELSDLSMIKEAYEKLLEENNKLLTESDTLKYKRGRDKDEYVRLLKKEREEAQKHESRKVQEVRNEYESKLEKMKTKMLQLYRDEVNKEVQKMKSGQTETSSLMKTVQNLQSDLFESEQKIQLLEMERNMLKANEETRNSGFFLRPEPDRRISTFSTTSRAVGRPEIDRRASTLPRSMVVEEITVSRRTSINSIASSIGRNLQMEDEDDDFNNKYLADLKEGNCALPINGRESTSSRFSELAWRNSLVPPHLKSSYPAEVQFVSPERFKEEDLKTGNVEFETSSCKLLPGEKPRKKDLGTTSYKKPGPPTPSKNGGRLSLQGNEIHPIREVEKKTPKASTPSRIRALFTSKSNRESSECQGTPNRNKRLNIFRRQK